MVRPSICIYVYVCVCVCVCLLLLISMLWHRQAIFKSKGDKLCSSAECRIWTRGPRHQIASRLNARWQTDWAIEDQAKKKLELDSPSLWSASIQPTWPHCQLTFAPGSGDIHVCCCNFDALAQASDIQIERRQVVFFCWMQDLNPGSQTPNRQQTEYSLTYIRMRTHHYGDVTRAFWCLKSPTYQVYVQQIFGQY